MSPAVCDLGLPPPLVNESTMLKATLAIGEGVGDGISLSLIS